MMYAQITSEDRHVIAVLRRMHRSIAQIASEIGRDRSTVYRELRRNRCPHDGKYRAEKADARARTRRTTSRRNKRFGEKERKRIFELLSLWWSPEQIAGWLFRWGELSISHGTIYRWIWEDRWYGGQLHLDLRQAGKKKRKRYGQRDSRGRLGGKRHISERPAGAENRSRRGHWEMDTVLGDGDQQCIVTLVERKTGYVLIGKLKARTTDELNRRVVQMLRGHSRVPKTITADNGTEFHGYEVIEEATGVKIYFATPYHSWERASNENLNGLVRQWLPKRKSMAEVTQHDCNRIAKRLNTRPRKRYGYQTPEELYED